MHFTDLVLVENRSVKQKNLMMHELYIALISFLGDSCTGEHSGCYMHTLCMVLTRLLI